MKEELQQWIQQNLLDAEIVGDSIVVVKDFGKFFMIRPKYYIVEFEKHIEVVKSLFETYPGEKFQKIIDENFNLIISNDEMQQIGEDEEIQYYIFQFGDRFYYCDDFEKPVLAEFKYLGSAKKELDIVFPYLGIHGGYDLCNGSREYKDWIKKAKFLGLNAIGIAEDNTLAGTLDFQNACKEEGIKSIIGETVTVRGNKSRYTVKLYVKNEEGWKNLLLINAQINVFNDGYVEEDFLLKNSLGLICVISPDAIKHFPKEKLNLFEGLYFQFDLSEWDSAERDKVWTEWVKEYLDNEQYRIEIPHVLVYDSYYLDKSDAHIRKILNKIGRVKFKNNSKHQWFKSTDEIFVEMSELFADGDDRLFDLLMIGADNLNVIVEQIDFKIPVGHFRLPKYKMTEEESTQFPTSLDMILHLINKGFQEKIAGKGFDEVLYWDRIDFELQTLEAGNVVDYFLILWDILNFCRKKDIWIGIGRGSAAGSLISYLIGLVDVNPIEYGLLFERFLNPGRIGKSLPDIDTDVESARRDEVKRYIESRYGLDYVTSIGTYSTMKVKAALGDLSRSFGVPASTSRFITKLVEDANINFTGLFEFASQKKDLKQFIMKHPKVIENIPLCMNQPKTSSVHAAGVVIVPEEYGTIYEQMPIKKMDGVLVSEWEGTEIDKAGFLKCDILGIAQLDKFANISRLIEKHIGEKISFADITDLAQKEVFDLFKEGYNEDVFQFGTTGLKAYCKKLKPDNIYDLIAAVALYRPGTMDTGMHEKYIRIKHGLEQPFYWYGCKEITKDTHGILIYQEQIMKVVQELGGFTLTMADDVRKALGKKDKELLDSYKDKFIEGAIKNGCPDEEAHSLWETMETFSAYSFNASHATCYAITGYYCQWFKVNYPLEFWTVSLQMANDKERPNRIAEINQMFNIRVVPVDINKSDIVFISDKNLNNIYWSINSIKYVGSSALKDLAEEKEKNGNFYSFEEFVERTDKCRNINKRCIKNLIIAGAFDEIENIGPLERYRLLKYYYDYRKEPLDADIADCQKWNEFKWQLMQKEISGFGNINFEKVIESNKSFAAKKDRYHSIFDLINVVEDGDYIMSGLLTEYVEKDSRNGKYCNAVIQDDTGNTKITMWADTYEPNKHLLKENVGKIIIISGKIGFDKFRGAKTFSTTKISKIDFI